MIDKAPSFQGNICLARCETGTEIYWRE